MIINIREQLSRFFQKRNLRNGIIVSALAIVLVLMIGSFASLSADSTTWAVGMLRLPT